MSEYKRLTGQKWTDNIDLTKEYGYSYIYKRLYELEDKIMDGTLVEQNEWISVKEKLPNYDEKVLVYVPKRDGCSQNGIFTANYKPIKADDGRGNFWRAPTEACEWTVWSWSYFEHPVVTHWIPLPIPPTEAEAKLKELQEGKK